MLSIPKIVLTIFLSFSTNKSSRRHPFLPDAVDKNVGKTRTFNISLFVIHNEKPTLIIIFIVDHDGKFLNIVVFSDDFLTLFFSTILQVQFLPCFLKRTSDERAYYQV